MIRIANYVLVIDGVPMPTPKRDGIVVSQEKIWSSDTGRSASGKMIGTLIGIKTTVQITWGLLTPAEADLIQKAVSRTDKPFSVMEYTDINGETSSKTVYFNTPSFTIRNVGPNSRITSATLSGIEQ